MSEKCPECNADLIELGTNETYTSTDYQEQTYTYTQFNHYGYWCKFCAEMYIKKHKSWLESWKYES